MSDRGLVDTHAHLMDAAFDGDREAVIERARAAGVRNMVVVGYDLASSQAAVDLARELPGTAAAVGIHPNSAAEASQADFDAIAELARAPEVISIGETGLDNYRDFSTPTQQRQAFDWHLRLAAERDLPIIIHNRQADADVLSLAARSNVRGVLHCFSSENPDYLERMLAAGFLVSFAGPLTFKNAAASREIARRVPLDRLLVETDCPYLAPEPHRGRRNEPAFVRDTATCLAQTVNTSLESLSDVLWANTLRAFPKLEAVAVQ